MRMDHHCPWMGNCVGLRTHKFFICYLFWTLASCLHVGVSSYFLASDKPELQSLKWNFITFNGPMIVMMAFCISLSLTIMFCMHLTMAGSNTSTLEYVELTYREGGNPYDTGSYCANLR